MTREYESAWNAHKLEFYIFIVVVVFVFHFLREWLMKNDEISLFLYELFAFCLWAHLFVYLVLVIEINWICACSAYIVGLVEMPT